MYLIFYVAETGAMSLRAFRVGLTMSALLPLSEDSWYGAKEPRCGGHSCLRSSE